MLGAYNRDIFDAEIRKRSFDKTAPWHAIRSEWVYIASYQNQKNYCLCGHFIVENCLIQNVLTKSICIIGNVCVRQFNHEIYNKHMAVVRSSWKKCVFCDRPMNPKQYKYNTYAFGMIYHENCFKCAESTEAHINVQIQAQVEAQIEAEFNTRIETEVNARVESKIYEQSRIETLSIKWPKYRKCQSCFNGILNRRYAKHGQIVSDCNGAPDNYKYCSYKCFKEGQTEKCKCKQFYHQEFCHKNSK